MSMAIQIWPLGSRYNPHRISSSFNISSGSTNTTLANQNHDPRPHVNISLYNSIFSALLDTGASVCLIDGTIVDNLIQQGHKFSCSSSTVFIQDCHSAIQESLGCYLIPFTILPTNMNVSHFKGTFPFHKVKNLSSSVLLGYDFMQKFGCQIQARLWPPISFMPYEAQLVSSSLKTIFSQGCHNVGAFNRQQNDIQNFIQMKTYALNPCDSATINPQDNQVIKFKLSMDNDTILKPGCPIVISSPDLTIDNCLQTVPQITSVQNNNSVSIRVFNNTPFVKELSAQAPVEGFKLNHCLYSKLHCKSPRKTLW